MDLKTKAREAVITARMQEQPLCAMTGQPLDVKDAVLITVGGTDEFTGRPVEVLSPQAWDKVKHLISRAGTMVAFNRDGVL